MSAVVKESVQTRIDENAVVVFSKSWCPYCKAAKETLAGFGAKFNAVELDQVEDGSAIQEALKEMTGQSTVPNIFIGGKHIGGNDALQSKRNDASLSLLLLEAGAGQ